MDRRGNQSKSGANHASPNWQNTADDDVLSTSKRGAADSGNLSSHVQGRPKGSEGSSDKKIRSSKKNSRSSSISSVGKSDDRASYKQQQMDTSCDISSSEENDLPSRTTETRSGSKKSSKRGFGKKVLIEQASLHRLAENVLEKTRCMACMAASIFRASMMYVVEESKRFIDRNRPAINTLMAILNKGHAYAFSKIEYVYPIVRAGMLNAGRLMLLVLAVWLDCNVRGFDSLLRLGTNSLLAVLWCSMLSILAMIGIKKMLIFMVWFSYSFGLSAKITDNVNVYSLVYDISNRYCSIQPSRNYTAMPMVTMFISYNSVFFGPQTKITMIRQYVEVMNLKSERIVSLVR